MTQQDPATLDWNSIVLPDAWPDRLSLKNPIGLLRLLRRVIGPRSAVELPADLIGRERLPQYLLHEFHRMPNGNFSNALSSGYARSFDWTMLRLTHKVRRKAALMLTGARSALDVGCGNGALAGAFKSAGIADVWGLDASPYLLRHAARRFPTIKFIHGLAEATDFPAARFDAAGACFLFHELPGTVADQVLSELGRIIAPRGRLVIIEPSAAHRTTDSMWTLLRHEGLISLYFRALSRFVYEPYVNEWQSKDLPAWLGAHGFDVISDETKTPFRVVFAAKKKA